MQAFHTACAITIVTGSLLAQAPASTALARKIAPKYASDIGTAEFVPFVTSPQGQPLRVLTLAAGAADLDGDKNRDLWFLGHGEQTGEIVVQFAQTSDLGRFYRRDPLRPTAFRTAATYRTKSSPVDQILAIDPNHDEPTLLHWNPYKPKGDPRDGQLGGSVTGWKIGKGVTEVACGDHAGDCHDDIVVLRPGANGSTDIVKLAMGTKKYSFLWIEQQQTLNLPTRLEMLRVLDANGDGRTDFVAVSPGIGVALVCDDPKNGLVLSGFFPTYGLPVRDLCTGDLDGNGRDDVAICFDQGLLAMETQKPTSGPLSFTPRVFRNPTGVGSLASCCLVQSGGQNTPLLFGFPRDGRNYVLHPGIPAALGIQGPLVEPAPAALTGPGVLGKSLIVTDVDNDQDPDLVLQSPNGTAWTTLRNPAVSFAFTSLTDEDKGPAPSSEPPKSRRLNVTMDVPQSVIDAGILFGEFVVYVQDPDSLPNAPEYLYWGRLMPAIDVTNKNISVTVFYDADQTSWDKRVRDYKKKRAANINTFLDVYPKGQWETIRGGPRTYLSFHAVDASQRFESEQGGEPKPKGSTLSSRWVLMAKPPTPTADLDPLPWE